MRKDSYLFTKSISLGDEKIYKYRALICRICKQIDCSNRFVSSDFCIRREFFRMTA